MNPVGNAYCDQCNARIVPMTTKVDEAGAEPAGQGQAQAGETSLPTMSMEDTRPAGGAAPAAGTSGEDDWLSQLRDPAAEAPAVSGPAGAGEVSGGSDDWLAGLRGAAPGEPAPGAQPTAAEPAGDSDDWLAGLRDAAPGEPAPGAQPAAAEPAGGSDDWLAGLRGAEPAAEPAGGGDDWLAQLRGAAPGTNQAEETQPGGLSWGAAAEPVPAAPVLDETRPAMPSPSESPDWLDELRPPDGGAAAPVPAPADQPAPTLGEMPDWLQELAPGDAPAAIEETTPAMPTPAVPPSGDVPDWLTDLSPARAETKAPTVEAAAAPASGSADRQAGDLPGWLQDIAPAQAPSARASVPTPDAVSPSLEAAAPVPGDLPGWLQEMAPPDGAIPAAGAGPPQPPAPPDVSEIPEGIDENDWLAEIERWAGVPSPAGDASTSSPGLEEALGEMDGLAPAEIPSWLEAMRPRTEAAGPMAQEEPVETEGLLEGLRGVLTPSPVPEAPYSGEVAGPVEIGEATLSRAQLLQDLLMRQPETPQPVTVRKAVTGWPRVQRWVVLAILLIPALVLVWHELGLSPEIPLLVRPVASVDVERLYQTVQGVEAGNVVLVAFEYGVAEADELDAVAWPLLQHLDDRGAIITVVSTQSEGLAVAELLWREVIPAEKHAFIQDTDRYRPGGATGVAQLLAGADLEPALVLVLTAQPGPLRWWVEQTRARAGSPLSVIAGVSASLEASASPYLDARAGQLGGMISGLNGAAAYEGLYGGGEQQAAGKLNAQGVGQVILALWILVGAAVHAPGGLLRRKS